MYIQGTFFILRKFSKKKKKNLGNLSTWSPDKHHK